jgi:hypothetical protein
VALVHVKDLVAGGDFLFRPAFFFFFVPRYFAYEFHFFLHFFFFVLDLGVDAAALPRTTVLLIFFVVVVVRVGSVDLSLAAAARGSHAALVGGGHCWVLVPCGAAVHGSLRRRRVNGCQETKAESLC